MRSLRLGPDWHATPVAPYAPVVIGEKIFDIIAHTGHQPGGMVVRSGEFRDGHAAGRPC